MPSPLTQPLRTWVLRAFPRGESGLDYDNPTGDPGLFDPASATWQVHADFAGMLSGGLCALVLQTLHPAALAGVWDHSNFRTDLVGRLRRTTHFVAGTSYAPRAQAQAQIARVRRIHDRVQGVTQTGEPYSANDPALLTWVHVTEAYGFLQGYRRFAGPVPGADADRYYDETRRIAEALGATDVPRSETEVTGYFEAVQTQLAFTDRSREVLRVLDTMRLPVPMAAVSRKVFLGAGMALLPDWARSRLGHSRGDRSRAEVAARLLSAAAPLFRAGLNDGPAQHACRRMGLDPAWVRRGFTDGNDTQKG
ncbi:oxygenase MpaB family protein [uncultured Arenimonas sp.]|uniref:oxygenase MpaB family protein n=1 Tax=uncultured Arenimonas sp. TaxID=546226 RepID=UPI0030DB78D4